MPSERSFGLTFACVLGLLSVWFLYSGGPGAEALTAGAAAAAFLALALMAPTVLGPLNRLWMRLGMLLHAVVNPVILGVLFYGVFTPMGFAMRLFGADLLRLRRRADGESYWIVRAEENVAPNSMTNQF